jgi:hypothetical protein
MHQQTGFHTAIRTKGGEQCSAKIHRGKASRRQGIITRVLQFKTAGQRL